MKTPRIAGPDCEDFDDSSLIDFLLFPQYYRAHIVVSTPDERLIEHLWLIELTGVLRVEFETTGTGSSDHPEIPVEIYAIYETTKGSERARWVQHLEAIGLGRGAADSVQHIVFASSSMCGWGEREDLEGIHIICRGANVRPAPKKYHGMEYSSPRIEGSDE